MTDLAATPAGHAERPAVSLIIPFRGTEREAFELREALAVLALSERDEVIVVANMPDPPALEMPAGVQVLHAEDHASSYYARNVGAEHAGNEWLLFLDADCRPSARLVDSYFHPRPASGCGAVAGEIDGKGNGLLARWASSRGLLRQEVNLAHSFRPSAVTANVLVRAEAWRSIGGFMEGIRSGGDGDFAWRLQDAGWMLEYRPTAAVEHVHRDSLRALFRQLSRHAAGAAWLNRRFPGSSPRPRVLRGLGRCGAGIVIFAVSGRFERATFKAIDGLLLISGVLGRLRSNAAEISGQPAGAADVVIVCDCFPRLSETFIVEEAKALTRLGYEVRFEVVARPSRPAIGASRCFRINYREDDTVVDRAAALAWAVMRHPIRSLRLTGAAARWRAGGDEVTRLASIAIPARRIERFGETRVHAHFVRVAALDALRVKWLTGVGYSVTAHGTHDIFGDPTNLEEKLEAATFVTTGCEYNARYLRELVGGEHADRIHEVVMGVDPRRFIRNRPLGGGRVIVSVGRLIETKGFEYLVDAIALLESSDPVDRLMLIGEGPLRTELEQRATQLGVDHRVSFLGAREPHEVREVMQGADLMAMPCVIASDGSRDSMPVVIKEAMALELMVVGTDEVGLPELVHGEWGRLVPPRASEPLAEAIADLLGRPLETRAEMGAAARAFVLEHCNVEVEASKLARLLGLGERNAGASDHESPVADRPSCDHGKLNEVMN